jgi:hypothetical protein
MVGQLRTGAAATLIIALLGVPAGLLWIVLAPRTAYVIVGGKAFVSDPEAQTLITADGWFAVLAVVAGTLCGAVAYILAGRVGEMGLLGALALGGTAAALVAWRVGHQPGLAAFRQRLHTGHDGTAVKAALDLHAKGVAVLWPLLALVMFGLLEALDVAGRESHRRSDVQAAAEGRQPMAPYPPQVVPPAGPIAHAEAAPEAGANPAGEHVAEPGDAGTQGTSGASRDGGQDGPGEPDQVSGG